MCDLIKEIRLPPASQLWKKNQHLIQKQVPGLSEEASISRRRRMDLITHIMLVSYVASSAVSFE